MFSHSVSVGSGRLVDVVEFEDGPPLDLGVAELPHDLLSFLRREHGVWRGLDLFTDKRIINTVNTHAGRLARDILNRSVVETYFT